MQDGSSKMRREYEAAKAGVGGQLTDEPYRIVFNDSELEMTLAYVGKRTAIRIPGLTFDAFHLGNALAVRDALNAAYRRGADEKTIVKEAR